MAAFFLDSSALVKAYIRETGTDWVLELLNAQPPYEFFIARITAVEVVSAIVRRSRGGVLAAEDASNAVRRFLETLEENQYGVLDVTDRLIEHAIQLARTRYLRGYDAVQLAAGRWVNRRRRRLKIPPLVFVSGVCFSG